MRGTRPFHWRAAKAAENGSAIADERPTHSATGLPKKMPPALHHPRRGGRGGVIEPLVRFRRLDDRGSARHLVASDQDRPKVPRDRRRIACLSSINRTGRLRRLVGDPPLERREKIDRRR